jgi:triacylglycerol lipase
MFKLIWTALLAGATLWSSCSSSEQASASEPAPKTDDARAAEGKTGEQASNEPVARDSQDPNDSKAGSGEDDANADVKCPKYPLVFHHGFMGGAKVGHFKGVEAHFQKHGCKVYLTEVAAVQASEYRAGQLKEQIEKILVEAGAEKVHVVAHSQGGLDARWAISKLGLGDRVASLSMLGTPNRGTQLADLSIKNSGPFAKTALSAMLNFMGKAANSSTSDPDTEAAVNSLTVAYVEGTFNPQAPDVPGVIYQSWGGATGAGSGDQTKALLKLSAGVLSVMEGANDGVVSVKSATWGEYKGTVPADHMDLIGYQLMDTPPAFRHLEFLDRLVKGLAEKGL